jgi:hypothetical protein
MDARGYSLRIIRSNQSADEQLLGVKLGRICIQKEYSVREIAEYFGVSRMTIYKWFTGEWKPRQSHCEKIEQVISRLK